jgi:hypothetical protein
LKYSAFRKLVAGDEDAFREFSALLVDVDTVPSDGADVVISPVRDLEVDARAGEIRLFSAAVRQDTGHPPLALFGYFMAALPAPGVYEVDFAVKVQLPIAPEQYPGQPVSLQPLAGVWIGRESEEIWLLVRPQWEYPADLLPA